MVCFFGFGWRIFEESKGRPKNLLGHYPFVRYAYLRSHVSISLSLSVESKYLCSWIVRISDMAISDMAFQ